MDLHVLSNTNRYWEPILCYCLSYWENNSEQNGQILCPHGNYLAVKATLHFY